MPCIASSAFKVTFGSVQVSNRLGVETWRQGSDARYLERLKFLEKVKEGIAAGDIAVGLCRDDTGYGVESALSGLHKLLLRIEIWRLQLRDSSLECLSVQINQIQDGGELQFASVLVSLQLSMCRGSKLLDALDYPAKQDVELT